MAQKSHKTDVRLYIEDDYKEYLKLIAEEQNISVNRLIMDVVQKKYPLNKRAKALLLERTETPSQAVDSADDDIVFNAELA